jgi:hypothetical protein
MRMMHWKLDQSANETWNLFDTDTGQMLAWIDRRPEYCDRGHWCARIEIGDLDVQDGWPNYYMDLETAMREVVSFLYWRLDKLPMAQERMTEREATMRSLDQVIGSVKALNQGFDEGPHGPLVCGHDDITKMKDSFDKSIAAAKLAETGAD